MPTIRRLQRLLRSVLRRSDVEAELDAEMRYHVELEAEELMKRGLPADEARRQAALAFGGVQQAKEAVLEHGALRWIHGLRRDVHIATRTLAQRPTFAVTAMLALALAIAVNTTMFSVIDAMMNPKIGALHPEQLYWIRYFGRIGKRTSITERDHILERGGRTYSAFTGWGYYADPGTVERGALVRQFHTVVVRPNYFAVLGIAPLEGTLAPPTDQSAAASTVVISNRLRAELFRENESPIGQTIDVDGKPFKVIGVTTRYAGSDALSNDIWMFPPPGREIAVGIIRLKEGVSKDEALKELNMLAARLALAEGEATKDTRFDLRPIARQFHVQRFHWALIGAGLCILLVASTNLANLQLARGLGRASEMALRSALGASRSQIVAQLMIESGVLAAGALVLAVLFALAGNAIVYATIPSNVEGYVVAPESSWRMILFAGFAAVVSMVLIGLAPALRVSRVDLNSLIKNRAGTGAHRANRRTYGALVIAQIALTLPLVCAAVLMALSAVRVAQPGYWMHDWFGFDTRPLIVATFSLPPSPDVKIPIAEIAGNLVSRARGIANVADAATVFRRSARQGAVTVEDTDGGIRELSALNWNYEVVSPSLFRTMGLPIERGKDFSEGGHTAPVLLLDRNSGWFLWPRSSPIGRLMKLGGAHSDEPWLKVEGIVSDHLSEEARAFRRAFDTLHVSHVYRLMAVTDSEPAGKYAVMLTLFVRASRDPQRVASALRHTLIDVTPKPPMVILFDDYQGISGRIVMVRFIAGLFTTFGALVLGLSALGVYGIVAQSAADRQHEVAVRISLGASPGSIMHALLREGNVLVLAGVAIGLYATKETIGWLGSFLVDTDLTNALLFGALCLGLFFAMVAAALVPAIRATKLDPMAVLRAE